MVPFFAQILILKIASHLHRLRQLPETHFFAFRCIDYERGDKKKRKHIGPLGRITEAKWRIPESSAHLHAIEGVVGVYP